jgi:hypothetical protein
LPYQKRKNPARPGCWQVVNTETGDIKGGKDVCMTEKRADEQLALLRMVKHGGRPRK